MGFGVRGEVIVYTIVQSELGAMLVGVTDTGVAAVLLGEPGGLLAALSREYPGAEYVRDDAALADVAALIAEAAAGRPAPGLPLDLRGTEFQQLVWEALMDVPRGETVTYTQLAEAIGRPEAVRAVANACGANHIAVLVPCHRAVRADGSMGGYKWGVERKQMLLRAERP